MSIQLSGTNRRAQRGGTIVEMMIVVTVFVLVATSIYGTLSNITHMQVQSDSSVTLQIEGQKALNAIVTELRTAGFYRLKPQQTLTTYNPLLWVKEPWNDPHKQWDVPYLFGGDGVAWGVFNGLTHTPAKHAASPQDEEYNATRELAFIPISPFVSGAPSTIPTSTISWSNTSLGAVANIVVPIQWQSISYQLVSESGVNVLKRRVHAIVAATMQLGNFISETSLARNVEAVRFDTAQTDASVPLYAVKVTIWLRKQAASGELSQAKVQSIVKLRNSL